jgi:hypothetical protein
MRGTRRDGCAQTAAPAGNKYHFGFSAVKVGVPSTNLMIPLENGGGIGRAAGSDPGRDLPAGPVGLKEVAEHLGLSVATVSRVLSRSATVNRTSTRTQDLVWAAAEAMQI